MKNSQVTYLFTKKSTQDLSLLNSYTIKLHNNFDFTKFLRNFYASTDF